MRTAVKSEPGRGRWALTERIAASRNENDIIAICSAYPRQNYRKQFPPSLVFCSILLKMGLFFFCHLAALVVQFHALH